MEKNKKNKYIINIGKLKQALISDIEAYNDRQEALKDKIRGNCLNTVLNLYIGFATDWNSKQLGKFSFVVDAGAESLHKQRVLNILQTASPAVRTSKYLAAANATVSGSPTTAARHLEKIWDANPNGLALFKTVHSEGVGRHADRVFVLNKKYLLQ